MIILGFDTATAYTAVGLLGRDGVPHERSEGPDQRGRPRHTTRALVLAHELLEEAELGFADVGRVAVGLGPGTFTGLRVGIAMVRALAQASEADTVGMSTLRLLAVAAHRAPPAGPRGVSPPGAILAVLDARRGEAYAGWHLEGVPAAPPQVLTPTALADLARRPPGGAGAGTLAVGDGALRFHEHLSAAGVLVAPDDSPLHRVSARVLVEMARAERETDPDALLPEYIRRPDAELAVGRRAQPPIRDP